MSLRHVTDKVMHIARQEGVFRKMSTPLLVGGSSLTRR
jgi:hypothetical protein